MATSIPRMAAGLAVALLVAAGAPAAAIPTADVHNDDLTSASPGSPDLPGVYRGDTVLLRDANSSGPAHHSFSYGDPGDVPLVGDWNGDGIDTLGIRRGNAFYLRNSNTGGPADITFAYGRRGDTVVVGDWNGDGIDTVGIRRGNAYYLRNTLSSGPADIVIGYGNRTDTPVVGDWNGDGTDTFGVRRGNAYYLRNTLTSGPAEITFGYGAADDLPIVGRWGPVRSAPPAPNPGPGGPPDLTVTTVADGLSIPWGLAVAPDGAVLFTERSGSLGVVVPGGTQRTLTADLGDVFASGETGVMGLVLDPAFAANRRFYTCQGHVGPEIQVIAWTVDAGWTTATRVIDPLVDGIPVSSGRHGGCRLRFDPGGQLLIGTGDAAVGTHPQSLTSLGGKVLRVDPATGAGSTGNPFASSGNADTRRIYTYGHRNVQGVAVRPSNGAVFTVEHGPGTDDEINQLVPGANHGWNPVPGYNEGVPMTDHAEFPDAVGAVWSSGSPTLATSGAIFLDGDDWGAWEGALAVASLKNSTLRLFFFDGAGRFQSQVVVDELNGTYGRLRSVEISPDGDLFVTTSNGSNDRILRIAPS